MTKRTSVTDRGLFLIGLLMDHQFEDDPRPVNWIIRDWPKSDRHALEQGRKWIAEQTAGQTPARIRAESMDPQESPT